MVVLWAVFCLIFSKRTNSKSKLKNKSHFFIIKIMQIKCTKQHKIFYLKQLVIKPLKKLF